MVRTAWLLFLLGLQVGTAEKVIFSPYPCGFPCQIGFDNGHLIYLTEPNHIEVFDRDGLSLFQALVLDPSGRSAGSVSSAAINVDDTVAVTAAWPLAQSYGGGIILFDRSGKQTRIIETGRFMPLRDCFDQNGYIWVFGWQRDADDPAVADKNDYAIARKYSIDGKEEGRYLMRKTFPAWSDGIVQVHAANGRIGLLVDPPHAGEDAQWIEIDLKGKLLGRWHLGTVAGGVAYTDDGQLFSMIRDAETAQYSLAVFDRDSADWVPVEYSLETADHTLRYGTLLGSDGEALVFFSQDGFKLIRAAAPEVN